MPRDNFSTMMRRILEPGDRDAMIEPPPARVVPPVPHYLKDDVTQMTDKDIDDMAEWAQDANQSVSLGVQCTNQNLDLVMDKLFQCKRCGKCCRGPLLEGVAVIPSDVRRISGHLGISRPDFIARYVSIKRSEHDGVMAYPCPFVLDGTGCSIYNVRPMTCRIFPLDFSLVEAAQEIAVQMFCPAAKDLWRELTRDRRDHLKGKGAA